jgi:dUTP pyrophosphatase
MIKVKVINKSKNELPTYKYPYDSGMDVRADVSEPIVIPAGQRKIIPTGLYFQIPKGYEIQIRPRSGLAAKKGVFVLNTPATIDCGYTGELLVILMNLGPTDFLVEPGDRIAQIVLQEVPHMDLEEVQEFTEDVERGENGLGSTGIK